MLDLSDKGLARLSIEESRAARLGLGHWAACSPAVRKGNARSHLLAAAEHRRKAARKAAR